MTPDGRRRIQQERESLEALAESDLACSWIAEELLEAATMEAEA
jgi:hypothetical protein